MVGPQVGSGWAEYGFVLGQTRDVERPLVQFSDGQISHLWLHGTPAEIRTLRCAVASPVVALQVTAASGQLGCHRGSRSGARTGEADTGSEMDLPRRVGALQPTACTRCNATWSIVTKGHAQLPSDPQVEPGCLTASNGRDLDAFSDVGSLGRLNFGPIFRIRASALALQQETYR